jgi:hypothetical protein
MPIALLYWRLPSEVPGGWALYQSSLDVTYLWWIARGSSYLRRVVESGTGFCKGKGDDTDGPIAEKTIPNMETWTGPVRLLTAANSNQRARIKRM